MILNDEQLAFLRDSTPPSATKLHNCLDTISDLKRQLREAVKVGSVAEMDREGGAYWTKAALDAYVQERLAEHNKSCWCPTCHEPAEHGNEFHAEIHFLNKALVEARKQLEGVQERVDRAEKRGWERCLDLLRASVKGYPDNGGDIDIMTEIEHIVDRAVLAESEEWRKQIEICNARYVAEDEIEGEIDLAKWADYRLAANRAKVLKEAKKP